MHKTVSDIKNLLIENNMWYEYFEHEPVRTSEEAASIRTGYTIAEGAKALIVRIKRSNSDKFFAMLVVPGNLKFDKNKVLLHFEAKDIRFANSSEVASITSGILPGGVPPFGNLFGLTTIADYNLFEKEKIIFNAGDKRASIAMKVIDYKTLVKPQVADIT